MRKSGCFPLTKWMQQHNRDANCLFGLWRRILGAVFAFCAVSVVASCQGQAPNLQERVDEYWQARIKGDLERTYRLEAPGVFDKTTYLKRFLKSPVIFKSYVIKSIKETGDQAVVELQMEYLLPGLSRPVSSSMTDTWTRTKSWWYHQPPAGDGGTSSEERG
jgi:hypothetical protein